MDLSNVLLLLFAAGTALSDCVYNKNENYEKHVGYGSEWMYFPDGNEIPTKVFLRSNNYTKIQTRVNYSMKESITFTLYTRSNRKIGETLSMDKLTLIKSGYRSAKHTKIIIHGWLSNGLSDTCILIKDAYLKRYDYNVIVVDWSSIAQNIFYPIPAAYTGKVAKYIANFLNFLIDEGVREDNMHLIGHSLGAHIFGYVGNLTNGRISRITGLDPALPGFHFGSYIGGLSSADAAFVDIIHTCGNVLGIFIPVGHVDFYPNGGKPPQPGCVGISEAIEACSHGRSWKYFAESINSEKHFLAKKCWSWAIFKIDYCENEYVPMGDPVPTTARGTYYLQTGFKEPFAFIKDFDVANVIADDEMQSCI